MLNTPLPDVGCFCRSHGFRYVSLERDSAFVGLVGDRKVNVARQPAIDLDEIRAALLLLIDNLAPVRFIPNSNGIGPHRLWTINDRAAEVNRRRWVRIGCLCGAPRMGVRRAGHISDTDDSVG